MRLSLLLASLFLLTSCNLAASLVGADQTYQYSEQSFSVTFKVKDNVVTDLEFIPAAEDPDKRADQLAFGANVRALVIGKPVANLRIASSIETEGELTEEFNAVLDQLRKDL